MLRNAPLKKPTHSVESLARLMSPAKVPMMPKLLLLVALAISASALAGSASALRALATGGLNFDRCPTVADVEARSARYVQLPEAATGVARRLPKVFASVPAQGRPFQLQMLSGSRMGFGGPYFGVAKRFCGAKVAASSYRFLINIPTAQNASQSSFIAFGAKARNGWRVYAAVQRP